MGGICGKSIKVKTKFFNQKITIVTGVGGLWKALYIAFGDCHSKKENPQFSRNLIIIAFYFQHQCMYIFGAGWHLPPKSQVNITLQLCCCPWESSQQIKHLRYHTPNTIYPTAKLIILNTLMLCMWRLLFIGVQSTSPGSQVYLYPWTPSSSPEQLIEKKSKLWFQAQARRWQYLFSWTTYIWLHKSDTKPNNKSDYETSRLI